MAAAQPASEQRLDELYREHPKGFVAGRNQLVKELRAAGDRDEAERVKRLRRPTVAAWLLNRAALDSPDELTEFADASLALEEAQRRALEGKDEDAAGWRAAAEREREAAASVIEVAERLARDSGGPAGKRPLELAGETLRAATADPELRDLVVRGRLERERSAATLGAPAIASLPKRDAKARKRQKAAEASRQAKRLEAELAAATVRDERSREGVAEAEEAMRQAKARLTETKRELAELKRRAKAARRRAED